MYKNSIVAYQAASRFVEAQEPAQAFPAYEAVRAG
jgi:hypothetical protein